MGYYMDEYFRIDNPYWNKKIEEILKLEENRIEWARKNGTLLET